MNNRISLVLKTKNMSSAQLADELGVQRSGISHILNGRNKPSLDFILRIIKKYPDISVNWLLFGEGQMMNPYPNVSGAEMTPTTIRQKSMLELFADTDTSNENYESHTGSNIPHNAPVRSEIQFNTPHFKMDEQEGQKNQISDDYPKGHVEEVKTKNEEQNDYPHLEQSHKKLTETKFDKDIQSGNETGKFAKKIDRIIVFYTDKSFREYYPE